MIVVYKEGFSMEIIKEFLKILLILITNKYFVIMLILSILVNFFYPKFRGFMGEFWVKQELKKLPMWLTK